MTKKTPIPRALSDTGAGESFVLPFVPLFGAMNASALLRHAVERHAQLQRTIELTHDWDEEIKAAFEKLRKGLSPDRFLADPSSSRALQRELARQYRLKAPESAINLRLLGLRKAHRKSFAPTETPARARHLIELYGPGVEAALRAVKFRYGASIDDMLAFPEIGEDFESIARELSPGATPIEYRLCALQIRKGRHLTGTYEQQAKELDVRRLDRRWIDLGSPRDAQRADVSEKAGLLELLTPDQSLYILRTQHVDRSIHTTFRPEQVKRLLDNERFLRTEYKDVQLRAVQKKQLPGGTLKTWELKLMNIRNPLLNLPFSRAA
jgi:hypothetical protein